jgi:hypothetical protein
MGDMSPRSCLDVTRHAPRCHSLRHFVTLAIAVLLLGPTGAFAQSVVDPTTAEFDPSPDHGLVVSGSPVVDHYELGFYLVGAAQPFQVNQLGKPAPDVDGKIRVGIGTRPAPGTLYEARVSALGPGGAGVSAVSNNFTFTAPCSYMASPTTQAVAAGGGAASVAVTTTGGCAWTATEALGWVAVTSGGSGTGNGTVSYTVAANTLTTSRTGTLTAAGETVTITQSGACSFAVSPTTQAAAAGGDVASVSVTTASGCAWTATESFSWITVTSGGSGTGNGTVSYSVTANTSTSPRTGTLTVAGQAITITQENTAAAPAAPSNVRILSKAVQAPSLEGRSGGIGAAPATSEQGAPVANRWIAAITERESFAKVGSDRPVYTVARFIERA